ncbi:hypothetical protein QJS10_CPA03g00104 [Acorus calamus]|uniref:Negative regulator of systemic acquired resistance SNI1 n=1 Tax=Acorus calamus TaxID=4465 RepID=A0AAV9FAR6_ACOCL|nr:hypothetical protein QJS10_CPA03g00104 [Acorus calamus]
MASDTPTMPTWKMCEAIFEIFRECSTLELTMASYQLLVELNKRYPRVYVASSCKVVVVEEAWSPFVCGVEGGGLIDSSSFLLLAQDVAQALIKMESQSLGMRCLRDMLLFQYLVKVLEGDLLPRYAVYKETSDWFMVKESLINALWVSPRVPRLTYKNLVKSCLSIISSLSHHHSESSYQHQQIADNLSSKTVHDCGAALSIAVMTQLEDTSFAVQKFLSMIMEVDVMKKEADSQGYVSRGEGSGSSLLETILDVLTYDKDLLSPFLQVFSIPRWKLDIVLQYFSKYCKRSSVRTRRSNEVDDGTFEGVLKCFSNATDTKAMVRKMSTEVAQLLLSHAFQAYLFLHRDNKNTAKSDDNGGEKSLLHICKSMISAFKNIRTNEHVDMTQFEKGALFLASKILSRNE